MQMWEFSAVLVLKENVLNWSVNVRLRLQLVRAGRGPSPAISFVLLPELGLFLCVFLQQKLPCSPLGLIAGASPGGRTRPGVLVFPPITEVSAISAQLFSLPLRLDNGCNFKCRIILAPSDAKL